MLEGSPGFWVLNGWLHGLSVSGIATVGLGKFVHAVFENSRDGIPTPLE